MSKIVNRTAVKYHWITWLYTQQSMGSSFSVYVGLTLILGSVGLMIGGVFRGLLFILFPVLILAGAYLIWRSFDVFFVRVPAARNRLGMLSDEDFLSLGNSEPPAHLGKFYLTKYYMCIPEKYLLIRYSDIEDIKPEKLSNGSREVTYRFTLTVRENSFPAVVDIDGYNCSEDEFVDFSKLLNDCIVQKQFT